MQIRFIEAIDRGAVCSASTLQPAAKVASASAVEDDVKSSLIGVMNLSLTTTSF